MKACVHLENIVENELNRGNSIVSEDNKWSSGITVITFEKPIENKFADKIILNTEVEYWENHDTHYQIQKGYLCRKCNISLASPID